MSSSRRVRLTVDRGIARIELCSPRTGNRIDHMLASELRAAAEAVATDDQVRVVLVTAQGRHFCKGGASLRDAGPGIDELRVAGAVGRIPQPVIAALKGDVFDQGLELALAADLRVAARDASFAMRQLCGAAGTRRSGATGGGMPFDGGTQRLPRIVGRGLAGDMLLTGRILDAEEALQAGLVTTLVATDDLDAAATRMAADIAKRGAAASRFAKEAILRGIEMPIDDGLRLEADLSILLFGDPERAEGLAAFREKRAPRLST